MANNLIKAWEGFPLQVKLDKIMEEAAEIVSAIEMGDIENLHEEVADMEYLLNQIRAEYNLDSSKIYDYLDQKAKRTLGIIDDRRKGGPRHEPKEM